MPQLSATNSMLPIPFFLANKMDANVKPGKKKRKGNPRITLTTDDGVKMIERIRRTDKISTIKIQFNTLSFNSTPCKPDYYL